MIPKLFQLYNLHSTFKINPGQYPGNSPSWVDLSDIANEGDWVRYDGRSPSYANWQLRSPDGGTSENCGYHWKDPVTGAIVFDDKDCNHMADGWCFVCQRGI